MIAFSITTLAESSKRAIGPPRDFIELEQLGKLG